MARMNMGKRPRVSSTSRGKWVASSKLTQNKDFRDRVSKFQRRPWIVEKGIEVPSFGKTHMPEIVATRRWAGFVQKPPKPNRSIVVEFYASMIPKRFLNGMPVLIQGVEVHISLDAINQYFVTPEGGMEPDGLPISERFEIGRCILEHLHLILFETDTTSHRAFYRTAGIEVDAELEEHAPSMLLLTVWSKLCHDQGVPTIGQYGERQCESIWTISIEDWRRG
ncbi:hypothetical protein Ddye_025548 [Dipteronia dyeriana]|uniref:Uncharacterized protein n=1 Tax=Dipteronia dyeriana TaxID=168575 RepID=A0AAD9TKZ5_9ROSI|nr:hypothetical protein Ddye_025548 [Dipteronia dyeriana]